MNPDGGSKGVLLALAIVLLWLAGLGFFIAFEGSKILGGKMPESETYLDKLTKGLASAVDDASQEAPQ